MRKREKNDAVLREENNVHMLTYPAVKSKSKNNPTIGSSIAPVLSFSLNGAWLYSEATGGLL